MKFLLLIVFATTGWGAAPKDPFDEFVERLPMVPSISQEIISKADHEIELEMYRATLISSFKEFYKTILVGMQEKENLLKKELLSLKDENSSKVESPSVMGRFAKFGW